MKNKRGECEFISRCPSKDEEADEFWVAVIDQELDGIVILKKIGHRSERLSGSAQQDLRSARATFSAVSSGKIVKCGSCPEAGCVDSKRKKSDIKN